MKPKILVSSCLNKKEVRWNWVAAKDNIVQKIEKHIEIIEVCPEVEIWLSIPRKPIRLVWTKEKNELIEIDTWKNYTAKMEKFSKQFLEKIIEVDWFILKSRSPSCWIWWIKIYQDYGKKSAPSYWTGKWFFAREIFGRFWNLAIEDEWRLNDLEIYHHFLVKIFCFAKFRELKSKAKKITDLTNFHAENKYLFMSLSPTLLKKMWQILANNEKMDLNKVLEDYSVIFYEIFHKRIRKWWNINSISHYFWYFSKNLNGNQKNHFLELLKKYKEWKTHFMVLIEILRNFAYEYDSDYLIKQSLLNPYPEELFRF